MARRVLTAIRLDKIAAVDAPCQEHATVAIVKRSPVAQGPEVIAKATFAEALAGQLLSEKVREIFYSAFDNQYTMNNAFKTALIDDLVSGGDGAAPSSDYVAAIAMMASNAVTAARQIGASATDEQLQAAVTKAIQDFTDAKQETHTMTITTKAALLAAIAKFDPTKSTVGELGEIHKAATDLKLETELPVAGPLAMVKAIDTSDLVREITILKMVPDVKKHFDALDTAAQTAFLAKSDADRTAEVEAKNATDPVVYKCADGTEIRKSDGATAAIFAKRFDDQDKVIKALTEQGGASAIEKALLQYPNVAKAVATTILKAAQTDEEKAAAHESLTAMNKALGGAFKRFGTMGGGTIEKGADTPEGQMTAIVKRIAKEQKISEAAATVEAVNDPEYRALYEESLAEVPHVQAYAPTV